MLEAANGSEIYYTNRTFTAVEFGNQIRPADMLNAESKKLTNIVKGAAIQLDTTNTCAIEKQVAMPICYGSAEGAWNAALVYPNGTTSNYPGKIFDNVGWVRGTKLAHGEWGAYLWVIQNKIVFQSSTSAWWRVSTNGFPVAITNVMVGSLGDYGPMSNVVDVGPHLDATTNYPGANQSDTKEYRVDISNVYYQLSIPDIWITPRFAVSGVDGSNVQYSVTGTNIPLGVTWLTIPDLSGSGGATFQSTGAWQAVITPGNIATNYKIRATSKDNTNFYDQVSLTVVGLQSPLQYKIGTNAWADIPDPLYVCKDTTVDFKAIKVPANASWPTNKPVWGGVVSGSGTETNLYMFSTISTNEMDYKVVTVECGNTVTGKVVVVKIEMITPAGDPTNAPVDSGDGQNEFTFSATNNPGVLEMHLKAIVTPSGIASQVTSRCAFSIDAIGNSSQSWDAAHPNGKPTSSNDFLLATVLFTGLPNASTAFGFKKASITFDDSKQDEESCEVFFDKNATNHPAGQVGSPNWYYFWSQTTANRSTTTMIYTNGTRSYYDYFNGRIIVIEDDAVLSQIAAWGTPQGIDCFAWTTAHEGKHHTQLTGFWPTNWIAAQDTDSDWLPNNQETNYMPGRAYSPTNSATYPDAIGYGQNPIPDVEDICMRSQMSPYNLDQLWTNGTANAQDWANPGKNSATTY